WINTGTVFARDSTTNKFLTNRGSAGTRIDVNQLVSGKTLATAADVVNAFADRFGLSDIPPETRAAWAKYVDSNPDGSAGYWRNEPTRLDVKVRGLLHLMLTSPDYHLC
ncbi:MAG TPA: hypothetical protein VKG01_19830, partial [Thermoanaerobaculia bacterium]|nr:hypothetical protein [Thermoanaerobaculia bacterium]